MVFSTMFRALLMALLAPAALLGWGGEAHAQTYRLTDENGVTHITNAPTDPRYKAIPGMSGTARGWLRVPEATRVRYHVEIREIAGRYGVEQSLVEAVIRAESAFNPHAVSRRGARGLMQLMPQTAYVLGVRDSFNPRQNIEGGVRHLRYLIDRYPGNLALALAAYNAGEGAVDAYGGIPPYPETQQYVEKILGSGAIRGAGGRPILVIYRYRDSEGTTVYSNIPPGSSLRVVR
ncbi:MAG TPA: transglycosylase SLT domain-containing protein [Methylomirabilota bacterium]|nr:transglycosylase SLT domain-containing protein [Methylomirabilota bacterium]